MGRGSAVRETASQSARVTSESYQMKRIEKRFDLSPEGVRLNVSAGLRVPLMSDCNLARIESQPTRFKLYHNCNLHKRPSCRWKVALNCASSP